MSYDHKPEDLKERERIEAGGGFVSENRVNGNLNLSRAFGDFNFKLDRNFSERHQLVINYPDVKSIEIEKCK